MHRRRTFTSLHHIKSLELPRTSPSSLDGSILFLLFVLFTVCFLIPRLTRRSVLSLVQKALQIDLSFSTRTGSRKSRRGMDFFSIYNIRQESFSLPFAFKSPRETTDLSFGSAGRKHRASSASISRSHRLPQAVNTPLPRYSPTKSNLDRQGNLPLPSSAPQYIAITVTIRPPTPKSSSSSKPFNGRRSSRPSTPFFDATDGQKRGIEAWKMPLGKVFDVSQRPRRLSDSPFFLRISEDEELKPYGKWRVGLGSDDEDITFITSEPSSSSYPSDWQYIDTFHTSTSSSSVSSSSTGFETPPLDASSESDPFILTPSASSSTDFTYLPTLIKETLAAKVHHPSPQLPSGTFVSPLLAVDWETDESFLPLILPVASDAIFGEVVENEKEDEEMKREVELQWIEIEFAEREGRTAMSLELL